MSARRVCGVIRICFAYCRGEGWGRNRPQGENGQFFTKSDF